MSFDKVIFVLVSLVVALLLLLSRRHQHPDQKEKDLRASFPWCYYSGLGIATLLALGPFKDILNSIGWVLFVIILGIGFKWQLRRK
jgi:hypothetical protein